MLQEAISGAEITMPAIPRQRTIELATIDPRRYRIVRELARGGMGRVTLAYDNTLGRTVALKEMLSEDHGLAQRFERELALTARLQHPAIACVHDGGMWPSGGLVFIMRLVEGERLDQAIGRARTTTARLALLPHLITACNAVAYAHARGIVHRDLKPANILVGEFGETVVVDWGLAKDLGDAQGVVTVRRHAGDRTIGDVLGTPGYMSPEQASGAAVDERTDVFALGRILEQLLAEIEAPRGLLAIAARASDPEPTVRHPHAGDLAADLRRWQVAPHERSGRRWWR